MALLDVTDVLSDPDFANSLTCERITQTIGEDGIAVNSAQLFPFKGVVTNNLGDILDRAAIGEHIKGNISVYTRFALQDGKDGYTADIVRWRNRRFTVANVSDYSHFGRGFVAASCDLIPLSG